MPRKKSPGAVQWMPADKAVARLTAPGDIAIPREKLPAKGQRTRADKAKVGMPEAGNLGTVVAQIRYWHRQRCFAMEQRKRMDLALGAFLRTMLGWSKDKPEDERKAIAKRAAELLDADDQHEWSDVIAAAQLARKPFADIEARALKEMSALAANLPAWTTFGESVRGFGQASLAVIVAEAGDLSNYSNPGKLWKRMGLAVMGDVRQGGLAKGASAEQWIAHGYNRQRRSRMWNIGDTMIKGNRDGVYRQLYLTVKAKYVAEREGITPMHAHRMAQRYMEKRLLKNLWQAWRLASIGLKPEGRLPAANPSSLAA